MNDQNKSYWDVQFQYNPWFSVGLHVDHRHLFVTLHLPGSVIMAGHCTGFPYSLRFGRQYYMDEIEDGVFEVVFPDETTIED